VVPDGSHLISGGYGEDTTWEGENRAFPGKN